MSKEQILDLIDRITLGEHRASSRGSTRWDAYREAEELNDPDLVDERAELLLCESESERRGAAYFIVGKLGLKVRAADCAKLLIQSIGRETNKYILSGLLDSLAAIVKPHEVDMGPVYPLLRDKRWLVRHSAIRAMSNCNSPGAEEQILDHLKNSTDEFDITYCNATLNTMGTLKAVPALELSLSSRKRDVKLSAKLAIEAIKQRTLSGETS